MEQAGFSFEDAGVRVHQDFYPTPDKLARKLAALIPEGAGAVLEPSAGKGNLAEAIAGRGEVRWGRSRHDVDVIEIVPELQSVLRENHHLHVVGSDFLQFQGQKSYDAIVMNPPFSEAARHVLHAWEILYSGTVIALVNAETIRNPYTAERQLLARIIEDHGEVMETIEGAFSDAERASDVMVSIIRLTKSRTVEFDYFQGMNRAAEQESAEAPESFGALAEVGSQIGNKVRAYNSAVDAARQAIIKQAEVKHYRRMLLEGQERYEDQKDLTAWVKDESNEALNEIQDEAWRHIVHLSEFSRVMTDKVRRDFEHSLQHVVVLEFTEANIRQFLLNLLGDSKRIFDDCLLEVFDELTKYHKENRVWIEGWRSDNYFFVNKRVVLPYIVSNDYGGFSWGYSGRDRILSDLDRIMAYMGGDRETRNTIVRAVDACRRSNTQPWGVKIESEHFHIRVFKKGTIHLYFKDLEALARFNLAAGRLRGWLPKEDAKVPKEFWLMNAGGNTP